MNILIVKTSAIGDVTHAMPALNCLRDRFPGAHITWLVEEAASDLVVEHPAVDKVLIAQRKRWVKNLRPGRYLQTARKVGKFISELRQRKYDLVIDFQGLLKSGVWVWLSRGKQRVGFGRGMQHSECSYIFLTHRVPAVDMEIHALDRKLLLLKAIDVPCQAIRYDFPLRTTHRQKMLELLERAGFDPKIQALVAINPQTMWDTKLWYNDRFAAVAEALAAKGMFVVFTGGGADTAVIAEIQKGMSKNSLDLTGKSSLKELAALYEMADVVISTDTGPMHIAAAVETPVVALFGPTAPWRTGPYGDKHTVLRNAVSCSPCFKRTCTLESDQKKCMKGITVGQVVNAAIEVLKEKS